MGSKWAFDPGKVIVDFSRPLLEGGLGPGAGSAYMRHRMTEAAKGLKINLATPFDQLPKKTQTALVEGGNGFPGILKILDETFADASEDYREWLNEYMSPAVCPACHGKRLRPSTLAVRVKNFSIAEFTEMPVSRALVTVRN